MSETVYRVLHLVGILLTFMSLGALIACARSGEGGSRAARFLAVVGHGIGLVIIIVAGFGLQVKMKDTIQLTDGWLLAKMGIWLALGGSVALISRKPGLSTVWWWLIVALGGCAGYLVWVKPF
ncbi:MAG: hypothetical protein AAF581_00160 [Planctomycetota bacterium]